jgi:dipeptidyl aminopeptidase/acylaminoacyl peptidase
LLISGLFLGGEEESMTEYRALATPARTVRSVLLVLAVISCGDATVAPPPLSPSATATRNRITVTSAREGNFDIYVIDIDARTPMRLTRHPAVDQSGDWSPEGSRIAFTTDRDGDDEIYVINADGTAPRRVTNSLALDVADSWRR